MLDLTKTYIKDQLDEEFPDSHYFFVNFDIFEGGLYSTFTFKFFNSSFIGKLYQAGKIDGKFIERQMIIVSIDDDPNYNSIVSSRVNTYFNLFYKHRIVMLFNTEVEMLKFKLSY